MCTALEDKRHEQHLYEAMLARYELLMESRPWLLPTFDPAADSAEMYKASEDLPVTAAEHSSMQLVIQELRKSDTPVRGLLSLSHAMVILEQSIAALKAALDTSHDGPARKCSKEPAPARTQVLCSAELLTRVMAFVVPGDWLYIATVSRRVQAAYTTALVQGQTRLRYMCGTRPFMAVSTPSRLEIAISCGLKEALPRCNKDTLNYAAGLSGSLAVLQRLRELGLQMTFRAVYGAAHCCDVSLLHTVTATWRWRNEMRTTVSSGISSGRSWHYTETQAWR
eukprot:TRINITY_DN4201_c0_g2_i1.p2 TRINITY_DN4201_c0_g2~~TRINITY_DN4201_c0_g2_i1.p2  ORF type:complete len:281 (-),score=44.77 TRINITY_DN4201_c0_g2_i1:951-1793(-)